MLLAFLLPSFPTNEDHSVRRNGYTRPGLAVASSLEVANCELDTRTIQPRETRRFNVGNRGARNGSRFASSQLKRRADGRALHCTNMGRYRSIGYNRCVAVTLHLRALNNGKWKKIIASRGCFFPFSFVSFFPFYFIPSHR